MNFQIKYNINNELATAIINSLDVVIFILTLKSGEL